MIRTKPDSKPNLTVADIQVGDNCIDYKLAYARDGRRENWKMPHNSNFMPPDFMTEGDDYAVWTEEIDVPYTTAKGRKATKKRHDWVFVMPLKDYEDDHAAIDTAMTQKLKRAKMKEEFKKVEGAINNFKSLFAIIRLRDQ